MAARTSSVNPDEVSGATVEMIREMVRRAETKLSILHSRKTQICRRIQALHHLSRTVAAAHTAPAFEDLVFDVTTPRHEEQASTIFENPSSTSETNENALRESGSSSLRRACRIALMECDQAEFTTQILQRIARRGAISINVHADSVHEVTAELNRMVADGEAITFGAKDTQRWQLNRSKNQGKASPGDEPRD
jgi:hypothetical protein